MTSAYPESLQKVLPPPESALQGCIWPVFLSWREAVLSNVQTHQHAPTLPAGTWR